ncbi:hypothetical protein QA584_26505 [Anaerocolumna sp. AGMB13025]|uniref:hypothetical protein n=1 Tax=Anaerocolumna sp. AGMB13025 TaxID=3039116 RepID=UPI00241EC033|nr:hypothetical protein [Anaerocolumna sp. AGMB13025]WFR57121.1 hypothetical protein QA584_26505 [Anaerocolumna sp. AGMB13025]
MEKDIFYREGYACYNEEAYELFHNFDKKFLSFIDKYDYEHIGIPALIDEDVLRKCGYFESFPGQVSMVGKIQKENIDETANGHIPTGSQMGFAGKYLTPSACLHIYPMLEEKIISKKVITTLARVYRFEEQGFEELTRMWDFTVREIVFVGNKDFVHNSLEDLKEKALNFAKEICPKANLEKAQDPFYDNARNRVKIRIQNKNDSKMELRVPIGDKEVSLGSFNYHNQHFSKPFHFDNDGTIVSGCVGFGIDRWVAVAMHQMYKF